MWPNWNIFGADCSLELLSIKNADDVQTHGAEFPNNKIKQRKKMQTVISLRGITNINAVCFLSAEIDSRFVGCRKGKLANQQYKCSIMVCRILVYYWDEHQFQHSYQIYRCEINVIWILNHQMNHQLFNKHTHTTWIRFLHCQRLSFVSFEKQITVFCICGSDFCCMFQVEKKKIMFCVSSIYLCKRSVNWHKTHLKQQKCISNSLFFCSAQRATEMFFLVFIYSFCVGNLVVNQIIKRKKQITT